MMPRRRRAIVFVVLLWVISTMVSTAIYFGHSARMAYLASENSVAGLQAVHAIDSAIEYVRFALETIDETGKVPDLEEEGYAVENVAVGEAHFWLLGMDHDALQTPTELTFSLVDEASKLNINTAELEMLEALPDMTAEFAAAIVDWRDEDSDLTTNGAESQDYLLLDTPYLCKDAPFESVEELRLVQGADLTLLFGEDENRNGILDPNEDDGDELWPPDDADGQLDTGIVRFLTAHSREPNTRDDGSAKVNLRGESARVDLQQLLIETLGQSVADRVMESLGPELTDVGSPLEFYQLSGLSATEFAQIEDALTIESGDYRTGLVNVATAPSEVLACLPGMTSEKAIELVEARASLDETTLESTAWLTTVLDADTVALVGPFVTSRSYQFGLDIAATGRNGRGVRRTFAVLDVEDEARVIYRRDLARAGWPLDDDTMAALREGTEQ
ncbi:MAG: hypothetical protein PWP23_824 [Candidatus Sumerlaeota bacterium]|nr:hypothetical protein [Candidatus Sumerlaeota bacterium]